MALLLNWRVNVCAEGGRQIWCLTNEHTFRDWFVKASVTQFFDLHKGHALLYVMYLQATLHRERLKANSRYEGDKQEKAEEGGRTYCRACSTLISTSYFLLQPCSIRNC